MLKTVIFAGGLGTRLGAETTAIPKPMVEIGGIPILVHIMKIYAKHGVSDFIVCLGYKGNVIKKYFADYFLNTSDVTVDIPSGTIEVHNKSHTPWRVTLVDTGADSMTGGRLHAVRAFLDDDLPFFLTYGDGLATVDLSAQLEFHRSHGRQATITAVNPPARFGSLGIDQNRVHCFREKDVAGEGLVNGGYFVCEPSVIDLIDGPHTIWEKEPLERLAADGQLMAFRHDGFWHPMDTMRDKQYLEQLWQDGAPWKIW